MFWTQGTEVYSQTCEERNQNPLNPFHPMLNKKQQMTQKNTKIHSSISLQKFVFSVVENKKSTDYTNYTEN